MSQTLIYLSEAKSEALAKAFFTKTNYKVTERIVQELSDTSDDKHVASTVLLNNLLKVKDEMIAANTAANADNKSSIDNANTTVNDLLMKSDKHAVDVSTAASGILSLDERVTGLNHLTISTVIGPISNVVDPKNDILYLQRDDEADVTWDLYIYRDDSTWARIGDTGLDLSGYWSKDENDELKNLLGVPVVTPVPVDKVITAVDSALVNTNPYWQEEWFDITEDGQVGPSETFKSVPGPINLSIPEVVHNKKVSMLKYDAYNGCTNIKTVTIPNSIDVNSRALYNCTSLETVVLPNDLTVISDHLFNGCTSLSTIELPSTIEEIGIDAFNNTALTYISIPGSIKKILNTAFNNCKNLTVIDILDTDKGTSGIGKGNWGANNATINWKTHTVTVNDGVIVAANNVSIEPPVNTLKVAATDTVIINPNPLENKHFVKWETSELDLIADPTNGNGRFLMPANDVQISATYIEAYFYLDADNRAVANETIKDPNLAIDLIIPYKVNSDPVNGIAERGFQNCDGIKSVTIDEFPNNDALQIHGNAFYLCDNLISVKIPNGYSLDPVGHQFRQCTNLTNVEFGGPTDIPNYAFNACKSLKSISIPEGATSIGSSAFGNCQSLESVVIPDTVTSIGSTSFSSCLKISDINIPASVTTISNSAFAGTPALTNIYVDNTEDSITGAPWGATNATVHWLQPPLKNINGSGIESVSVNGNPVTSTASTPPPSNDG